MAMLESAEQQRHTPEAGSPSAPPAAVDAAVRALVEQSTAHELSVDRLRHLIAEVDLKSDDLAPLKAVVLQSIHAAETWQRTLQDVLEEIDALALKTAESDRFTEEWWDATHRVLEEVLQAAPPQGMNRWIGAYLDALLAWRLDICGRLVSEPFSFPPDAADLLAIFRRGTFALTYGRYFDYRYGEALPMLGFLADRTADPDAEPLVDTTARALLLLLLGRVLLYAASDSTTARVHFEQAKTLLPDDARPDAALAEYYRVNSDRDQALRLSQQAAKRASAVPDAHIALGLVFETDKHWDEADDWYEEAIRILRRPHGLTDVISDLDRLMAPVSGNVYLQLARMLVAENRFEPALDAVDIAVGEAAPRTNLFHINHDGSYTERIGYRLMGQILEELERPSEAADAHFEAGYRFAVVDEHRIAIDLFERARTLKPDHVPTYWELADALRRGSDLPTTPHADGQKIAQSLKVWQEGAEIAWPDPEYAWAYNTRALLCEELAGLPDADQRALWWEAVAYIERGLLLDQTSAQSLAFLARYHRSLRNHATASHASARALNLEPDNVAALDEQAGILFDAGRYAGAEQVINHRLSLAQEPWVDGFKAEILLFMDQAEQHQEARDLLTKLLEILPDDVSYRGLRALSLELLGEPDQAAADHQWIWDHRDDPGYRENPIAIGWAAYSLGLLDDAIPLFAASRSDPGSASVARRNLGLCYLRQGDPVLAEEELRAGIALASTMPELDELASQDFPLLLKDTSDSSEREGMRDLMTRLTPAIEMRRSELQGTRSPLEELNALLPSLEQTDGALEWAWVGAQAGRARLLLEAERWDKAFEVYLTITERDALRPSPTFPESRRGVEEALLSLSESYKRAGDVNGVIQTQRKLVDLQLVLKFDAEFEIASVYASANRIDDALAHVRNALVIAKENEDRWQAHEAHMLNGDILWDARRLDEAHAAYLAAKVLEDEMIFGVGADGVPMADRASTERFTWQFTTVMPPGWWAGGEIRLIAPDGRGHLIVSREPVDQEMDAGRYARDRGDALIQSSAAYRELEFAAVEMFGGRQGYLRRFEFAEPDGDLTTHIELYCVEGGRAYVATATMPSEDSGGYEQDMRLILSGLRFELE